MDYENIRPLRLRWCLCALLATTLTVTGCNDSGSSDDGQADKPQETAGTAPMADAGKNQNVKSDALVTLDGSASMDADGDMLTYIWKLAKTPDGSKASLSSATRVKPVFTADKTGTYKARLTVNDGQDDSKVDTVTIVAASDNSAPVADAGRIQRVSTGQPVSLDGSGSRDADGDNLTYAWAFSSRPSGSSASLDKADTVSPTFTPDADGDYRVSLEVNDGRVDSAASELTVAAASTNSAPVAVAGPDQNVVKSDKVTFNGSASRDADGDALTYQWRFVAQPQDASSELNGADGVAPSFRPNVSGDYVVGLVVNGGDTDSEPDNVAITVVEAGARPVADAGADRQIVAGNKVRLDASGSRDADGDELNYAWAFVSKPKASKASLSDAATVAPDFTPEVSGDYVLRLVVNDGSIESKSDRVTIKAAEANVAPTADAGDDNNVKPGVMVTLNGTKSADANGDALSYDWRVVSIPKKSRASLVNKSMAKPSFTPDVDGTYVFELMVSSGGRNSRPDRVKITAAEDNSAPISNAGKNQTVATGEKVTLDGTKSHDADSGVCQGSCHLSSCAL